MWSRNFKCGAGTSIPAKQACDAGTSVPANKPAKIALTASKHHCRFCAVEAANRETWPKSRRLGSCSIKCGSSERNGEPRGQLHSGGLQLLRSLVRGLSAE